MSSGEIISDLHTTHPQSSPRRGALNQKSVFINRTFDLWCIGADIAILNNISETFTEDFIIKPIHF